MKKPIKSKEEQEREKGRKHAKEIFDNYLINGTVFSGDLEECIYCEPVAGDIRDGEEITDRQIAALEGVRKRKSTPYYEGLIGFLLGKIADYRLQRSQSQPVS